MKRRMLGLLLAACLAFTAAPVAYASSAPEPPAAQSSQVEDTLSNPQSRPTRAKAALWAGIAMLVGAATATYMRNKRQ